MQIDLNSIWFLLIGVLLTGYAVLDGFDLGAGALHLFARTDNDRRVMLNAIGPVWDGNEVWLVAGGGALFAAFPHVYATVFSGFYTAFMLFLAAIIFRAVSIEFRSKLTAKWWRELWDICFSVSSALAGILIGVAMGNLAWGIPISSEMVFDGNFLTLIHPYSLITGILVLALFMMHGALYLLMKTEGDLHSRVRGWVKKAHIFVVAAFGVSAAATLLFVQPITDALKSHPVLFILPVLNVLVLIRIPGQVSRGHFFRAFLSSCFFMIVLMTLFGIDMYPNLAFSNPVPENSLTIYNAASSQKTLKIMLLITAVGMPLILTYTTVIYRVFRGKVKPEDLSY